MKSRALITAAAVALLPLSAGAKHFAVNWTATVRGPVRVGGAAEIAVKAEVDRGWFMYGMQQPPSGPTPLRFRVVEPDIVILRGVRAPRPQLVYDEGFRARVSKYTGSPVFILPVSVGDRARAGTRRVRVEVRWQACNTTSCLPPRTQTIDVRLRVLPRA